MCKERVQALRVLRTSVESCTEHRSYDQWRARLAAEHIAELRSLIEYLIEADSDKVNEHQLCYGPQSRNGGSGRHSNNGALGNWGVDNALASEFTHEASGDAHDSTVGVIDSGPPGASGDVLSDNHHCGIPAHF